MVKLIEFVCSGNNDRSPTQEHIANNYIARVGADKEFRAISSGTDVKKLLLGNYTAKEVIGYVNALHDLGWVYPEIIEFREAFQSKDPEVENKVSGILNLILQKGKEERDAFLISLGFGPAKQTRDQTMVRGDVSYVLAVDRKNHFKVLEIYSGSIHTPKMYPSASFTNGRDYEMDNAFKDFKSSYSALMERIAKETPLIIQRIIGA